MIESASPQNKNDKSLEKKNNYKELQKVNTITGLKNDRKTKQRLYLQQKTTQKYKNL